MHFEKKKYVCSRRKRKENTCTHMCIQVLKGDLIPFLKIYVVSSNFFYMNFIIFEEEEEEGHEMATSSQLAPGGH